MHLPCLAGFQHLPGRMDIYRRARFHIYHAIFVQALRQDIQQPGQIIVLIRRVQKDHVILVPSRRANSSPSWPCMDTLAQPSLFTLSCKARITVRFSLHHHHAFCPARSGLETHCAAAGKQIQAGAPMQCLPQPVEQGLAHAIRCRAQPFRFGEADQPAAQRAADDPDLIQGYL